MLTKVVPLLDSPRRSWLPCSPNILNLLGTLVCGVPRTQRSICMHHSYPCAPLYGAGSQDANRLHCPAAPALKLLASGPCHCMTLQLVSAPQAWRRNTADANSTASGTRI